MDCICRNCTGKARNKAVLFLQRADVAGTFFCLSISTVIHGEMQLCPRTMGCILEHRRDRGGAVKQGATQIAPPAVVYVLQKRQTKLLLTGGVPSWNGFILLLLPTTNSCEIEFPAICQN